VERILAKEGNPSMVNLKVELSSTALAVLEK
jgi:hypothetical protein